MSNRLLHGPRQAIGSRAIGSRAPRWPFALNPESPHARGLIAAFPLMNGSGTLELLSGRLGGESGPASATEATFGPVPGSKQIRGLFAPEFGGGASDDAILYDDPPAAWELTSSTKLTVAAWIHPRSNGQNNQGRIADNDGARSNQNTGWTFRVGGAGSGSGDRRLAFAKNATSGTWNANMTLDTGYVLDEWNHVACVVDLDAGTVRFFRNGAFLEQVSIQTGAINASGDPLAIGRDAMRQAREFDGWIADVRIWGRASSDRQVRSLWHPQTRWSLYRKVRVPRIWPATGGATTRTVVASLQAAMRRQAGLSASLDAAFRAEALLSALSEAAVAQRVLGSASLDLAAQSVRDAQADLEAALRASLDLGAGLDASLTTEGLSQRAAALDGAIRRLETVSGVLEAALLASAEGAATLDAWLALGFERSAGLDAAAELGRLGPDTLLQAALRATPDRTAALDAVVGLVVAAARGRTHKVSAQDRRRIVDAGRRVTFPKGE